MAYNQIGSGWQGSAHGLVWCSVCMGSALALLILVLSKEAAS